MTVAADFLSLPLVAIRDLVAGSSTFQGWVAALTAEDAKASVPMVRTEMDTERPFALVDFGELVLERYAVTSRSVFQHKENSSTVTLWFEAAADGTLSESDEVLAFTNKVGAIISEIAEAAVAQQSRGIVIREIELDTRPDRMEYEKRQTEGDLLFCGWTITYTRQPS
jgi:hypothetical protein